VVVGSGGAGTAGFSYGGCIVATGGSGGSGVVRIVWPGSTRKFPSACVGSP
jgi:hypothetical protein